MVNYYSYLWSTTWPNLIVLFLIWCFVFVRLGWKSLSTWRNTRDAWGFLMLAGKILIWVAVLGAYTQLLLLSQPDWFAQPGYFQGVVQAKTFDPGSNAYVVDIQSSSEQKKFTVDQKVYELLKVKEQVKLMYLPSRREVVRCEILGNLL